jgi:hypothetical protein
VSGDGVGWLRWSGKSTTPREASLRWVGAPGPTEEERGRLVRSGDGEPIVETGAEAATSLLVDSEASGADKMQGRRGPFVPARPKDGRDNKDGSTRVWGNGTARCCAEVEHARALQTTAMVPTVAASFEGYAKRTLSVCRCLG